MIAGLAGSPRALLRDGTLAAAFHPPIKIGGFPGGLINVRLTDKTLELSLLGFLEATAEQLSRNGQAQKAASVRCLELDIERKVIINGMEMNPSQMRVKDLAFINMTVIQMLAGEELSRDENPVPVHERVDDGIFLTEVVANPVDQHPRKNWDKVAKLVINALWNANIIPDAAYDNAMDDMIKLVAPVLERELDE